MKRRNLSRLSCIFVQALAWQEVDSGARSWDARYWLRSPTSSYTDYVYCVRASGQIPNVNSAYNTNCARPAFKISIN